MRRGDAKDSSTRLLDLWQLQEGFGAAFGCVTTTYTFDGPFFEEECLSRFVGMETDPTESARTYMIEREEKFSDVFAAVLVDRKNVARNRSLRWHQLPVAVAGGKILHAKVSLLAWTNRIRVLIGSANLTKTGYRTNYEQIAALDFGPDCGTPISLLDDAIAFLGEVARFLPPARSEEKGPVEGLKAFLARVSRIGKGWPPATQTGGARAIFLPMLPRGPSLFEQIREVWQGTGASAARVTSPFFDQGDRGRLVVEKLVSIMGLKGEREVTFHTSGTELPGRSLDLALPESFREPWLPRVNHEFVFSKPHDENGDPRALHTKCLILEREDNHMFLIGSSNFTAAGTGIDSTRNVEANLAYVVPPADVKFWRACLVSLPPSEAIDLDRTKVRFMNSAEHTADSEMQPPLPQWFELALFDPSEDGGILFLSFRETSHHFAVKDEDGQSILSSSSLTATGAEPYTHMLEWQKPRPPSYLLVDWLADDGISRESIWVVNVTDTSKLPPPDELRDLSLEMLIEVLTSSRPLYEAVERAIERQERIDSRVGAPELDPHRRVDTSSYLLKRVQRVSKALEGLRERLEQPALTIESLRWRLRGPLGALALARGLVREKDPASAFLIAEIALTLNQVRWREVERLLGREAVREQVFGVQHELQSLLEKVAGSKELDRYARSTFREIGL